MPSNTIIVTNVADDLIKDPQPLVDFLLLYPYTIRATSLFRFHRIILHCQCVEDAEKVFVLLLENFPHFTFTYSRIDNQFDEIESLPLPDDSQMRRFLISPPVSPPPEWDHWDKVEEQPHSKPIYSPEDLESLLWMKLGALHDNDNDSEQHLSPADNSVRKVFDDTQKLETHVLYKHNNDVPVILLDSIGDVDIDLKLKKPIAKTGMPPVAASGTD